MPIVKVLIVDDDEDLLEMVSMMLKINGMQVKGLNAGKLLNAGLTEFDPDILLMDIYLGDSDGRELARDLKDSSRYSHLPVVLYSAGEIEQSSIQASGADYFLRKPFEMSDLINQIQYHVAN